MAIGILSGFTSYKAKPSLRRSGATEAICPFVEIATPSARNDEFFCCSLAMTDLIKYSGLFAPETDKYWFRGRC